MYKIYTRTNSYFTGKQFANSLFGKFCRTWPWGLFIVCKAEETRIRLIYLSSTFPGGSPNNIGQDINRIHVTTGLSFPPAAALKLPTNVVDINASEMGIFSPHRERDISGPVISSCYKNQIDLGKIDITVQSDPHVNKYDCRGAVSLSSSMQSNVPSPFSGNHTHLNMPGSQWGQGHKYLSDHLHSAHYLTLRNEYRARASKDGMYIWIMTCLFTKNTDTSIPTWH